MGTDPSLRPPGFPPIPEASDVKPEPMPQLDGHHDEGGLGEERPLRSSSSSPNRKTTSESRLFKTNDGQSTEDEQRLPRKRWEGASKLLPQLDGEGDEEELGDATIHDLDEQMDLSHNQSLDAAEENIEDADSLAKSMEGVKIRLTQSDCLEAFQDPSIGGIALALPHGSVVIECAKAELHATTALSQPNREEPHRIGLVFYQHKNLHHPNHGVGEFQRKRAIREFRDYVQWLKGNYVPTESKLRSMVESGFVFPESCKSILKPEEVGGMLRQIDTKDDLEVMAGYLRWLNAAPEPDDEVDFRPLLQSDEYWIKMGDSEEVKALEDLLEREERRED